MSGKLIAIIMVTTLALASVGWVCMVLFQEDDAATVSREDGNRALPLRDVAGGAARESSNSSEPIPTATFLDPVLASDPGRPAILVVDQIGRPVENAHVWIRPGAAGPKYGSDGAAPSEAQVIHGRTDDKGRFLLESEPERPFRVDAISGDLRGKAVVGTERSADALALPAWVLARVKLFPERVHLAYVTARLMKADGSPARRTKFVVLPYRKSGSGPPGSKPGRLFSSWYLAPLIKTTDENGRFAAAIPPETEGFLSIRMPPPSESSRSWLWTLPGTPEPLATVAFPAVGLKECKDLGDVTLAAFDKQLAQGGLAGRVRFADEALGLRPVLAIGCDDQGRMRGDPNAVQVGKDGTFEVNGLPAGTYRLRVSVNQAVEQELGGLQVVSGQVVRPLEINDLVVGAGLYRAFINVRDSEGHPVSEAEITLAEDLGRRVRSHEAFTDRHGLASVILARSAKVSVHVSARGRASQQIPDAHFPLDLVLRPGIDLKVTLSSALPRIEDTGSYFLHVIRSETDERLGDGAGLPTGGRTVTLAGLPHGSYRVAVVFRKSIGIGEWSSDITVPLGAVIIREKPSSQTSRIPIDLAEVTRKMRLAR